MTYYANAGLRAATHVFPDLPRTHILIDVTCKIVRARFKKWTRAQALNIITCESRQVRFYVIEKPLYWNARMVNTL